jgi:hypothetical protein
VAVKDSDETTLRISLPRFGAITGRVVDENDVGLPEMDVIAYRSTRPPTVVAKAVTDDRGMYRLFNLEPGSYLVRSGAKQYEDGGYLPTFYRDATNFDYGRPSEVVLDEDTVDVSIRPTPGRLYSIAGQAGVPGNSRAVASVTLMSDMGPVGATDSGGRFRYDGLPPGKYELYAQGSAGRDQPLLVAYQPLELERDLPDTRITVREMPDVQFVFEDAAGTPVEASGVQVIARRKELSGDARPEYLRLTANRTALMPGRWDFSLAPNYAFYVAAFSGPSGRTAAGERADLWNEAAILPGGASVVRFLLSTHPGALHGTVLDAGRKPAAGAPVYLEPYDAARRRRLGDLRTIRTDIHGKFQFAGLAPGGWRVLSSFETQNPDSAFMDHASAQTVIIEEGRDLANDLVLYVAH